MTQCLRHRAASALFANSRRGQMRLRTGKENCASIIATKPIRSEDSCATTAISPLVTLKTKRQHALWSNISDFTVTQIESIEPSGIEEVFDIQVERTENFIANGLVSHNTRWNDDDLSGWLLSQEVGEDEMPERWHVVSMPAIKGHKEQEFPPTCTVEIDDRQIGEALCPERYDTEKLAKIRRRIGAYYWNALYDQRPSPDEGGIFKRHWWRYWKPSGVNLPPVSVRLADGSVAEIESVDLPGQFDEVMQSWDCAFKDSQKSDFVAGQVWARNGANRYMLDYYKDRADIIETMLQVERFTQKWPKAHAKLIEDKANGPAVMQILGNKVSGLIPVEPEGGKIVRAHAAAPSVESGNVYLPHPALYLWVGSFIDSCAGFPNMSNDDDVDAFTQAMIRWQGGTSAGTWGSKRKR